MSQASLAAEIKVDDITFPSTVKPPASNKSLFLGGAGIRGLEKEGGKFVKVMGIGVYMEDSAVPRLAEKWKGKSAEELTNSAEFFADVITGPFEKFTRVTMVLPISGQQYAERMSGSCIEYLKSAGTYSDAEATAIDKFVEAFKEENFSPGASMLFTQLANGSLAISFSQDESIPKVEKTVIENKLLSEALLESMIGKNGVSPATKKSMADRLSVILKQSNENGIGKHRSLVTEIKVDAITFSPIVMPPASKKTLFLGGAGIRGLEKEGGKFVKVMGIGVYLEDAAVPCLAMRWKGKSAEELNDSVEFFTDIITGSFEKFTRVTMVLPITGQQYAERISGSCIEYLKSVGAYTDAEAKAIEKFMEAFKEENFPPGASILFTQLANGSLAIGFSKDESVPEIEKAVIENEPLSVALLELMIGKNGISPTARKSLAERLSQMLKESNENGIGK